MTRIDLTRRQALTGALAASMLAGTGVKEAEGEVKNSARRRLRVGMSGFPRTFDPVIATDTAIRRVMPQLFDTLIAFDHSHGMALRPALAEHWARIDARSGHSGHGFAIRKEFKPARCRATRRRDCRAGPLPGCPPGIRM